MFIAIMAISARLFFSGEPATFDVDGLFHYRVASQMWAERQLWMSITSLPYTVLGSDGVDHQWLFHLLLAPLTAWGDEVGYWLAATAMVALPVTGFYVLARWQQVPMVWLFTMLAFLSSAFVLPRYLMMRTQSLVLVLMLALLFAMTRQQYRVVAILAWGFLSAYHGATIMLPMMVMVMLAIYWRDRTLDLRLPLALGAGVAIALLLSPWFPANTEYLIFHVLSKVRTPLERMLGAEWQPIALSALWVSEKPIVLALCAGVLAVLASRRWQMSVETVACGLMSVLMAWLMLSSQRFIEYWIPLTAMTLGLLARDYGWLQTRRQRRVMLLPALALCVVAVMNVRAVREDLAIRHSPAVYAQVADYVRQHGNPGDLVFNTRWSDYSILFFHLPDYRFVTGLDGHYLAYGDPARFNAWYNVVNGRLPEGRDVAEYITASMPVRWIVVSAPEYALLPVIDSSPRIVLRESTMDGWLFEVLPAAE